MAGKPKWQRLTAVESARLRGASRNAKGHIYMQKFTNLAFYILIYLQCKKLVYLVYVLMFDIF